MKAKYITSCSTRLNPFSPHSKVPRLVLALLPPNAHRTMQIKTTQLPRASTQSALLELGFKDGKTMKWEWKGEGTRVGGKIEGEAGLQDIIEEVNRHARILGRKEELQG